MASWQLLGTALLFGSTSTILLSIALLTDHWYIIDASLYTQVCSDNNVLADFYPWPIPFYGLITNKRTGELTLQTKVNEKAKQQSKELELLNFDLLLSSSVIPPITQPVTLAAPLMNPTNHQSKLTNKYSQVKQPRVHYLIGHSSRHTKNRNMYNRLHRFERKHGLGFSRTARTAGKVQSKRNAISMSLEQPSNEIIINWFSIMNDLNRNLHSFGARDITQRRYRKQRNITISQDKTKKACSLRQFTTVTGIFRTCYLPKKNSFLQKSIDCGNLTRCVPISYMRIDYQSSPVHLLNNETRLVLSDERNFLELRRAMVSFLFLALGVEVFGVLIASFGWYRNVGFEQNAGGLVQLMSGILHLAGMCAHILWCHLETNRQPRDIYAVPPILLQSYGTSCYMSWIALVFTLLSCGLCVIAAWHRPRSRFTTQIYDSVRNVPQKEPDEIEEPSISLPQDNAVDPKSPIVPSTKTKPHHEIQLDSKRKVSDSQQFEIRTPAAAIRALQEERNEILQLMTQTLGTPIHSLRENTVNVFAPIHQSSATHSLTKTNHPPKEFPSSSRASREIYKRRTMSLPRDIDPDKLCISTTSHAATKCSNINRNNKKQTNPSYSATLSRLDNVFRSYSNERNDANQVKIAELFRSTSLAKAHNTKCTPDQNDECYSTTSS